MAKLSEKLANASVKNTPNISSATKRMCQIMGLQWVYKPTWEASAAQQTKKTTTLTKKGNQHDKH